MAKTVKPILACNKKCNDKNCKRYDVKELGDIIASIENVLVNSLKKCLQVSDWGYSNICYNLDKSQECRLLEYLELIKNRRDNLIKGYPNYLCHSDFEKLVGKVSKCITIHKDSFKDFVGVEDKNRAEFLQNNPNCNYDYEDCNAYNRRITVEVSIVKSEVSELVFEARTKHYKNCELYIEKIKSIKEDCSLNISYLSKVVDYGLNLDTIVKLVEGGLDITYNTSDRTPVLISDTSVKINVCDLTLDLNSEDISTKFCEDLFTQYNESNT